MSYACFPTGEVSGIAYPRNMFARGELQTADELAHELFYVCNPDKYL